MTVGDLLLPLAANMLCYGDNSNVQAEDCDHKKQRGICQEEYYSANAVFDHNRHIGCRFKPKPHRSRDSRSFRNDGVEGIVNGYGDKTFHSYVASTDISSLIRNKNDAVEVTVDGGGACGDGGNLAYRYAVSTDISCLIPGKNDGVEAIANGLAHSYAASTDISCLIPGKNDGVEAIANKDRAGPDLAHSYAASVDISCLIPGKNDGVEAIANKDRAGPDLAHSYAASVDIGCLIADKNDGVEAIASGVGSNLPHSYAASVDISCLIPDKNDGVEAIANGVGPSLSHSYAASVDISCLIPEKNEKNDGVEVIANADVDGLPLYFVTSVDIGCVIPDKSHAVGTTAKGVGPTTTSFVENKGIETTDSHLEVMGKATSADKLPRSGSFSMMPDGHNLTEDSVTGSSTFGISGDDANNDSASVGNFIAYHEDTHRNHLSSTQVHDSGGANSVFAN